MAKHHKKNQLPVNIKSFHATHENVSRDTKSDFQQAKREMFYLWLFVAREGLYEDAREFIEESMDNPVLAEEIF